MLLSFFAQLFQLDSTPSPVRPKMSSKRPSLAERRGLLLVSTADGHEAGDPNVAFSPSKSAELPLPRQKNTEGQRISQLEVYKVRNCHWVQILDYGIMFDFWRSNKTFPFHVLN